VAIRELIREVSADDDLVPVLLPVGDGLLLAKKALATGPARNEPEPSAREG
jgi:hypothetical protein